jgi:hypothetical protein
MLLFRSAEEVEDWCSERGLAPGAIVELAQLARLARAWYGDRLDPSWHPRSPEQSQAVLERVGLTGDFWRLR